MILKSGDHWEPEQQDVLAWEQTYKKIDVHQELMAMESWCDANPSRRKTKKGIKRFVNAWLSRANDQGGSPYRQGTQTRPSLRDWTNIDFLSHDFLNSESYRRHAIRTWGQYVDCEGVRHVFDQR